MPKKKDALEWGGYLNMRLSSDQKHEFGIWHHEMGDDVWELFLQSLQEGMKVSLVYDSETDTYTCSLTNSPRCKCGVNAMYVLSAYAQDWRLATALVLFKHYVILGGTWANYKPTRAIQDKLG